MKDKSSQEVTLRDFLHQISSHCDFVVESREEIVIRRDKGDHFQLFKFKMWKRQRK